MELVLQYFRSSRRSGKVSVGVPVKLVLMCSQARLDRNFL
jgi:hypothetical protein